MTPNRKRQLVAVVLFVVGLGGCAKCPPAVLTGGSGTCKWSTVPGNARRDMVCMINSVRVTVDTTGVGEG